MLIFFFFFLNINEETFFGFVIMTKSGVNEGIDSMNDS